MDRASVDLSRSLSLAATVPITKGSVLGTRVVAGVILICIDVILEPFEHVFHFSHILVFWLVFGLAIILATRLNVTKLWWLGSELLLGHMKASYSVPPEPAIDQSNVKGMYIEIEDYFCSHAAHDVLVESSAENPNQPHEVDWRKFYIPVIAKTKRENGQIDLWLLGKAQPHRVDPEDRYSYRPGPLLPSADVRSNRMLAEEAAKALIDLVYFLPRDRDAEPEDLVVGNLVYVDSNSDSAARNAIRIAISTGLVMRRRGLGYVLEFLKILSSRTISGGHPSCHLSLTELGLNWSLSERETGKTDSVNGGITMHIGDINTSYGSAGIVGSGNTARDFTVNHASEGVDELDMELLAQQLAELRTALTAQASTSEHARAIDVIASAQIAAIQNDQHEALAHLARLTKAAKWVVGVAGSIGVPVAIAAINNAFGIR
jgi:hypothetical protein